LLAEIQASPVVRCDRYRGQLPLACNVHNMELHDMTKQVESPGDHSVVADEHGTGADRLDVVAVAPQRLTGKAEREAAEKNRPLMEEPA
jgi:hypothetical protein